MSSIYRPWCSRWLTCGEIISWLLRTICDTRSCSTAVGVVSVIQSFQEMKVIRSLCGLITDSHRIVNNIIPENKQLCITFLGKQPFIYYCWCCSRYHIVHIPFYCTKRVDQWSFKPTHLKKECLPMNEIFTFAKNLQIVYFSLENVFGVAHHWEGCWRRANIF